VYQKHKQIKVYFYVAEKLPFGMGRKPSYVTLCTGSAVQRRNLRTLHDHPGGFQGGFGGRCLAHSLLRGESGLVQGFRSRLGGAVKLGEVYEPGCIRPQFGFLWYAEIGKLEGRRSVSSSVGGFNKKVIHHKEARKSIIL